MSSIRTMRPYWIYPVDLDPPEIMLSPAAGPAVCGSYAHYCGSCQRSPSQRCHATRSRCS